MNRKLRSGRNYDASKAPAPPKRRSTKRKASTEADPEETSKANKPIGEQAIVPMKRGRLTFGTTLRDANDPVESVVIVGTGKRRGIALAGDDGVKISPSAYLALMRRVPPIRRVMSWPLPTIETRTVADAPVDGEATSRQSVEAADRAPVEPEVPGSANRAPAAIEAPTTPTTSTNAQGPESHWRPTGCGLHADL